MKRVISGMLCLCLMFILGGCEQSIQGESDVLYFDTQSIASNTSSITEMKDEYKIAQFNQYNSFASENGLDGDKVQVVGLLSEMEVLEEKGYAYLKQADGYEWLLIFGLESEIDIQEIEDSFMFRDFKAYGVYTGFSGTMQRPVIEVDKFECEGKEYVPTDFVKENDIGVSSTQTDKSNDTSSQTSTTPSSNVTSEEAVSSKDSMSSSEHKKRKWYGAGTHKVGVDIPAGEYYVTATSSVGGYYAVNADSKGDSILANDNFKTNGIITIEDGQYIELSRSKACLFSEIGGTTFTDGILQEGMYQVGKDIEAGEYKVHSTSDVDGYYAVVDGSGVSNKIITNDNFEGDTYLTVEEGQYLILTRCELLK